MTVKNSYYLVATKNFNKFSAISADPDSLAVSIQSLNCSSFLEISIENSYF